MMSNEEEKRCPLCAEEMDWTDQQFRPCKCGYQICVWCWHHIIDMAEKDEMEGRCPACRTIYEKEKIISMQANCERITTKISSRKSKLPKAKPKVNEVKKDLTNVRVIQRKMAYVIGLPLSLADEAVLRRKEYFGQYGKVTKVALSRTAGGAIQQFVNDSCSVYITYSKEEEALRCIQSVHGFVLEGRFLRASFGTAKYCHAWLKNTLCNNPACLYLHAIGSDEDSFGKDEVAAVQTRSRVQQIVGATNGIGKRSGNVLPPADVAYNSSSTFTDKSTIRSGVSDATHDSPNCTGDVTFALTSEEKEGAKAAPHNTKTFLDVVGQSNCASLQKDSNMPDDRRIVNLCSELSSATINGDTRAGESYSFPTMFTMPCSNQIGSGVFGNLPDDSVFLSDDQGSNDSHKAFFGHLSYPAIISEDSSGPAFLHEKIHSVNGFTVDHNPVHNHETEAALPIRCVNSVLMDSCQEMKFQNSAKSDRIYRNSNSFSNEEIVEHLRRIDDGDLNNDKESSILDAVGSSIISNIMSIGLDSCEDSLTISKGLSEFLDETDGLGGSSWSSLNSDQSGYSFIKHEGFANQMVGSVLPECGDNKEQYFYKPQFPVCRSQSLAPPGFSVASRDPPPGFSTSGRMASSGTGLVNSSTFPNTFIQTSSTRTNSSMDGIELFEHSLSNCSQSKLSNGFKNPSFETRPASNHNPCPGPTHQNSNFSQMFMSQNQQELSYNYKGHQSNGQSGLDAGMYGLSHQGNDHSFFSQSNFANGHNNISNMNNGYRLNRLDGVQHNNNGEVAGMTELQRNERLGVGYFQGYGGLRFNSGDVYTGVFGL
ncbi:RNA binding (RRM/RBD/RNP motifs) family protein [Striga asiatica]|uniref:RNA binding (RRM/RBD/RNP motifs) family protein n=1 Tax=Striga asiatica TaxID=4170 RepID=A0A5A7QB82_STRAF|nr:RNA binding (RRM/RBD/RNP motifs) family protein [Striga asiatica]